jgi:hypothetical protein
MLWGSISQRTLPQSTHDLGMSLHLSDHRCADPPSPGLVCIFVDKNIASDRPLSSARVPNGLVATYKICSATRPMVIHTAWLASFLYGLSSLSAHTVIAPPSSICSDDAEHRRQLLGKRYFVEHLEAVFNSNKE